MGNKIFNGGSHGSGSWTDPLNWVDEPPFLSPGPPAPGDSVYIDGTVVLTADLTLTNLTVWLLSAARINSWITTFAWSRRPSPRPRMTILPGSRSSGSMWTRPPS